MSSRALPSPVSKGDQITVDDLPALARHTYVRLTAIQLWDNLPLVLLAGFVFSLLGLPALLLSFLDSLIPALLVGALTIAPGWAALLALEADIVQDRQTNIWVMFKALPRYGARSVGLGLLATFPLFAALLTLPNLVQPKVPLIVWLGLAADALGLLLLITLFLYAFPLLVLHDVDGYTALRNAFILASRYILNTLGLLSMGILFSLATLYLSSGLLLIWPTIWGIFIVNNCRLVMAEELAE